MRPHSIVVVCFKLIAGKTNSPGFRYFELPGFLFLQNPTILLFPPLLYHALLAVFRLLLKQVQTVVLRRRNKTRTRHIVWCRSQPVLQWVLGGENKPWSDCPRRRHFRPRSRTRLWTVRFPCWCRSLRVLWWARQEPARHTEARREVGLPLVSRVEIYIIYKIYIKGR